MKIVIISNLDEDLSQGPNWSVPARAKALERIDDVYWLNCNESIQDHWLNCNSFHKLSELKSLKLCNLPLDFQYPDYVIFEGFYHTVYLDFARELHSHKIPYIIAPRSSLTKMAQKSKRVKKICGNLLFFYRFARNACAIQYLTSCEKDDSGDKWNSNYIISPNGIELPHDQRHVKNTGEITAITVGRLNKYQKGYDLLIDACGLIHDFLIENNFKLILYGEKNRDYPELVNMVTNKNLDDIITFGGLISGERKKEVLKNASFFIMTSRFEGHPMGLIEALAYGLPSLVTSGSNMSDEIYDFNAGWVCESTPKSIADVLKKAVVESLGCKEKQNGARILAGKYEWNNIVLNFHNKLIELKKTENGIY